MRQPTTNEARAKLIVEAARYEELANCLRELSDLGRPAHERMGAAPELEGWRWDTAHFLTIVGNWHSEGDHGFAEAIGPVVANMPACRLC